MAVAVLKVSCDDHIYRISVPWESDSASLWRLIESAVPGLGQRTLVFVDPVGKEQPLSSSTYSLFKSTAREAVSGRPILKLEAVPVTADSSRGSPPLSDKGPNDGIVLRLRAYAGRGRRQPRGVQQTRTWEEDPRDLDELLAQFDTQDSNAATVKKPGKVKKRKNTTERSSLHSGEVLVEEKALEEGNSTILPRCEQLDGAELAEPQGLLLSEAHGDEPRPDRDQGLGGSVFSFDSTVEEQRQEAYDFRQMPRSASCPCFPVWPEVVSSDLESVSGQHLPQWPVTPESTPPVSPRGVDYHQVVWVPVWVPMLPG